MAAGGDAPGGADELIGELAWLNLEHRGAQAATKGRRGGEGEGRAAAVAAASTGARNYALRSQAAALRLRSEAALAPARPY